MKLDETWLGAGVKSGGQLLIGGFESVTGVLFNMANLSDRHTFEIDSSRWGIGLGGSAGVTAVCVFNLRGIYWLDGREITGNGLNVAFGDKIGNVGQYLDDLKFLKAIKLIAKDAAGPAMWYPVLLNGVQAVGGAINSEQTGEHMVVTFDIPYGGIGLELSVFKTSGTMYID